MQVLSAQVKMNLVTNRQKLQPFLSEGFVYKDRKKRQVEHGEGLKMDVTRAIK